MKKKKHCRDVSPFSSARNETFPKAVPSARFPLENFLMPFDAITKHPLPPILFNCLSRRPDDTAFEPIIGH